MHGKGEATYNVGTHYRIHNQLPEPTQITGSWKQEVAQFFVSIFHQQVPGQIQGVLLGDTSSVVFLGNRDRLFHQLSITYANVIFAVEYLKGGQDLIATVQKWKPYGSMYSPTS